MPAEIEVNASGEGVEFKIEDEQGAQAQFRLDRRLTTALVVMGLQELSRLPPLEGELLQDPERPLLQGRPSFQVAIDESGDALVAFRLHPLSTMNFLFDDELSSKLLRELSEVLATPRPARVQRNKN
ncbi:hypothetical protein [Bradyrhizobium sp. dw_411]|uniref:hypothetical protein n=1 Tax=Bradyrhizobium sp. dw_411 TaxID=2720082 RepID=UPI001BD0F11A|nr:hypothetical protein [Bradyrhizobium sp. dw_411]